MDLKRKIAQRRAESGHQTEHNQSATQPKDPALSLVNQHDPDAVVIPVEQIIVKAQGRKTFKHLEQLAADIEANGLLQPVLVKVVGPDQFELIAGERRYRAVKDILKQDVIAARIRRVDDNAIQRRFVQISENAQRDNYLPMELAIELNDIKETSGLTNKAIAVKLNKTESYVTKYLSLLKAPGHIQTAIAEGRVSATQWFNDKELVLAMVDEPSTPAGGSKSVSEDAPVSTRQATVCLSMHTCVSLAKLLQKLAEQHALAPIDVDLKSGKPSKKQLQAILLSRAEDVYQAL